MGDSETKIATGFVEIPSSALSDSILMGFIETFVRQNEKNLSDELLAKKVNEIKDEIEKKELGIFFDFGTDNLQIIKKAKANEGLLKRVP